MSLETAVATAQDFEMSDDPESPLQQEIARIKAGKADEMARNPQIPEIRLEPMPGG